MDGKNMKIIEFDRIVQEVENICAQAAFRLPIDVLSALKSAQKTENFPQATDFITQIIDNAAIAQEQSLAICQDTGYTIYFVEIGNQVQVEGGNLLQAIQEGTRRGYKGNYLRSSIVSDPLFDRKNTGDNTPAVVHCDIVNGDKLKVTILPKGGGCENMSALAMLKPSQGKQGVIDFVVSTVVNAGGNPCPPVIVGVGIGGSADKAMDIAKKALLRDIGESAPDKRYADLENEILTKINQSGNGPQGLGGKTTALAVHIEHFPCHIASLPVAVNINCHAARKATFEL